MPNLLVQSHRRTNPDSVLSDDEITLQYFNDTSNNIEELFSLDPLFKADVDRIMGITNAEGEPATDSSEPTAGDWGKMVYNQAMRGFADYNIVTGGAETIGIAGSLSGLASDAIGVNPLPEGGYMDLLSARDYEKTAAGEVAGFIKEDVYDLLTPEIEKSKYEKMQSDMFRSQVPEGLGAVGGMVLGGGIITQISKHGLMKLGKELAEAAYTKTIVEGTKKKLKQEVIEEAGRKAAKQAYKKVFRKSQLKQTMLQGALINGPAGYDDAIDNGATPAQAFTSWMLNMGIGTTEALPINRMLSRVSGIAGTKGIYKSLIMAGREGLEEAFQELLQQGLADAVAKWVVKYDPDRTVMAEWEQSAQVGGYTGIIFSLLTSAVGSRIKRNKLKKVGIDLDKIPEVDAKIRSGEALNESEAALARSAGVEVDDKGFVVLPETDTETDTEEVAATAYSGGNEEAIIALAQKEAEEGFTREVEEEYNKLIGIRGTSEEDVLARELYDKTKFKAQSDVDAKKAEDETNEFLDGLARKMNAYVVGKGEKLTDEELEQAAENIHSLGEFDDFDLAELQAAEDRKGSPLTDKEKVLVLLRFEKEAREEESRERGEKREDFFNEEEARSTNAGIEREIDVLERSAVEQEKLEQETKDNLEAANARQRAAAASVEATKTKNEQLDAWREKQNKRKAPPVIVEEEAKKEDEGLESEEELQKQLEDSFDETSLGEETENGKEIASIVNDLVNDEKKGIGHAVNIRSALSRIKKLRKKLEGRTLNGKPIGDEELELLVPGLAATEADIIDYQNTKFANKTDKEEALFEIREGSNGWQFLNGTEFSLETTQSLAATQRRAKPTETETELPDRSKFTDNYAKPLNKYTDSVWHETSLDSVDGQLMIGVTSVGGGMRGNDIYLSNTKELALGQGEKGVILEFDASGISGQINQQKPNWGFAWDNGNAEFIARETRNDQRAWLNSLKSITIKADATSRNSSRLNFERVVKGWDVVTNADGSQTFTKPKGKAKTKSTTQAAPTGGRTDLNNDVNTTANAFDKASQPQLKKAQELADNNELEKASRIVDSVQRQSDDLSPSDVAIEPNKQAKAATGGPGYFSPYDNSQEGNKLGQEIDYYKRLETVKANTIADLEKLPSGLGHFTRGSGKKGDELIHDITIDSIPIGSGKTVKEALANAKKRQAERIAETLSVGYKSNISKAATHRIGIFAAPDGKVVALGIHRSGKENIPMVPNLISEGIKGSGKNSMSVSELMNTYGYSPIASIRTKNAHNGLKESYNSKDDFDSKIGGTVSGIQGGVSDAMVGMDQSAIPSKTTRLRNTDQRQAPRRDSYKRPSEAKVNTSFSNIIDAARTAGVEIRIVQREFADMEKKAAAYMTYEDGKAIAVLAMESVNDPSVDNHTDLLHEIGHVSFDNIDPEVQTALLDAISKASDKALGIEGSEFIFDDSFADGVPNELTQEERLVESIAREMAADGFDPAASKGLVGSLVRIYKNLTFNATMAWQRMIHGPKALSPNLARRYFRLKVEALLTNSKVPRITDYLVKAPTMFDLASTLSKDLTNIIMKRNGVVEVQPLPATSFDNVRFNLRYAGTRRSDTDEGGERVNRTIAKRGAASNNFVLSALRNAFVAFTKSGANRNVFGGQRIDEETFLSRVLNKRGPIEILNEIETETDSEVTQTKLNDLDQIEDRPRAAQDADRFLSGIMAKLLTQYEQAMDSLDPSKKKSLSFERSQIYADLDELRKQYENLQFIANQLNEGVQSVAKNFIANPKDRRNLIRQALDAIDPKLAKTKIKASIFENQPTDKEMDDFTAMVLAGVDFSESPKQILKQIDAYTPSLIPDTDMKSIMLAKFMVMAKNNPVAVSLLPLRQEGAYRSKFDEIIRIAIKNDKNSGEKAAKRLSEMFDSDSSRGSKTGSVIKVRKKVEKLIKSISEKKKRYEVIDKEINQARDTIALYETVRDTLYEERAIVESMYDKEENFGGTQWEPTDGSKYYLPTNPDQPISEVENFTATLNLEKGLDIPEINRHIERISKWLNNQPEERRGSLWKAMQRQRDKLLTLPVNQVKNEIANSFTMSLLGDYATQLDLVGSPQALKVQQAFRAVSKNMNTYGGADTEAIGYEWAVSFDRLHAKLKKRFPRINKEDVQEDYYDKAFHYFERNRDVLNENPGEAGQRKLMNGLKAHLKLDKDIAPIIDDIFPDLQKLILVTRKASNHINKIRKKLGLKIKDEYGDFVFFRESIGDSLTTTMRKPHPKVMLLFSTMKEAGWDTDVEILQPYALEKLFMENNPKFLTYASTLYSSDVMKEFVGPLARNTGEGLLTGLTEKGFKRPIPQSVLKEAFDNNPNDMMAMLDAVAEAEGMTTNEQKAEFFSESLGEFQKVFNSVRSSQQRQEKFRGIDGLPPHIMMDARRTSNWPQEWVTYASFGQRNMNQYTKHLSVEAGFGRDMVLVESDLQALENEVKKEAATNQQIQKELRNKGYHRLTRYFKGGYKKAFKELASKEGTTEKRLITAEKRKKIIAGIRKNINRFLETESSSPMEYHALIDLIRTTSGFTVQGLGTAGIDTISIVEQPFRKLGLGAEAFKQLGRNIYNSIGLGTGSAFQIFNKTIGFQAEKMQLMHELGLDDMTASTEGNWFSRLRRNYRANMVDDFVASDDDTWRSKFTKGVEVVSRAGRALLGTGAGRAEEGRGAFPSVRLQAPFSQLAKNSSMANIMSTWDLYRTLVARTSKLLETNPEYAEIIRSEGLLFNDRVLKKHGLSLKKVLKDLGYGNKFLVFNDTKAFLQMQETLHRNGFNLEMVASDYSRRKEADPKADPIGNKDLYRVLANLTITDTMLETDILTRPMWMTSTFTGQLVMPLFGWSVSKSNDVAKELREPGSLSWKGLRYAFMSYLAMFPAQFLYAYWRDIFDEEIVGKKSDIQAGKGPLNLPTVEQIKENPIDSAQIVIERLDRVGSFGVYGEVLNKSANYGSGREMGVDSRVYALNTIYTFVETLVNLGRSELAFSWQKFGRPLTQSMGGSGYLQNAQIVNNLVGKLLDGDGSGLEQISEAAGDNIIGKTAKALNTDYLVNHRIGVQNYIRGAARQLDLDIRKNRGMAGTPSKMKVYVSQMMLAAIADDYSSFIDYKLLAIEAAKEEKKEDPEKSVLSTFQTYHPLKQPFKTPPTESEYRQILDLLDEDARKGVTDAIDNINKYIERLGGNEYMGKKEKVKRTRMQRRPSSIMPRRDYRSSSTAYN